MPVFRVAATKVSAAVRKSLLQKLKQERQNPSASGEPMVFEIPVEEPDRIEVLVVWQEWENVPSAERTSVILDAYKDQRDKLAQAVGVTYEEAMQQQLLPYSIVSRFEVSPKFLRLVSPNRDEALSDSWKSVMPSSNWAAANDHLKRSIFAFPSINGRGGAVEVARKTSERQLVD